MDGQRFLLVTHRDPDVDGIGSILAFGKALLNAEKRAVLFTEKPVPSPSNLLKGAGMVVQDPCPEEDFDAVVVLDCSEMTRVGARRSFVEKYKPLINIDHHETNDFFGDLNLVDTGSSSTGELVYKVIKAARLTIDYDVAENIFAAIQTDTGSFRYDNTTAASMKIAAEMISYGVKPSKLSRKLMHGYTKSGLRLLELALGSVEYYHENTIGMMTVSLEMIEKTGAQAEDSEGFVDFPRFVLGVEVAVLISQTDENEYKFSLRSNNRVNVALLASRFAGGGHAKAAGFSRRGSIDVLKREFLREAVQFL